MNKIKTTNLQKQMGRIHPLVATAAVAVTLVSLVGIAAITGVIPTSHGTNAPAVAVNNQTPLMTATPNEPYDSRTGPNGNTVVTQSPNYVPMQQEPVRAPAPVIKHAAPHHVATTNNYAQDNYQVAQATCSSCGRVESVVAVQHAAQPSGLGIAAGAVLGGVLGNQVGGGNGRTLATVAGAVAGGYGGNEVEKRTRSTTTYQVRVRMENGEIRTFPQNGQDGWRTGDRVRVVNGALTSRG